MPQSIVRWIGKPGVVPWKYLERLAWTRHVLPFGRINPKSGLDAMPAEMPSARKQVIALLWLSS